MSGDARIVMRRRPRVPRWVRLGLVLMVLGWLAVFVVAAMLNPYFEDGTPRMMETHRQLNLPECNFKALTGGYPCPSCGMTTSFALLVRGDVWNSLRANCAGTALALFGMVFVPWAVATALKGRVVWIRSVEAALFRLCVLFMALLLGRWAFALWLTYTG